MKLNNILPALEWLPKYDRVTFRSDLIAGLTVAIMLVPQGMAYAYLAGMPPIYGLYGGLVPLFIYAFLGTSRQLSLGPVAVSSLLVLAGVSQLAEPASQRYVELVLLAGLLIGVMQMLLGVLRLGFIVNFLSTPVIKGFTSAAAIIIAGSQLKDMLGFTIPRFSNVGETGQYAIQHIAEMQFLPLAVCLGGITLMLIFRRIHRSIPGALITVVLATVLTYVLDWPNRGLDIIGQVPEGLPALILPSLNLEDIRLLIPTIATVTIIGVVECISIAKVLETKHQDYSIRVDQELFAVGLSKIGGAFFQALPTSASFTRSAVNSESGGRTGVSSIISAIVVALTLLFFTPLFYYIPKAILAAIILLAVRSLFDYQGARRLWKSHRRDFYMMLLTFIITLGAGITEGVFAGVLLSVLSVLYRSSKPHVAVLGNLPGTSHYRNVNRFDRAVLPKEMLIVRFDDQLYFGNATYFKDIIKELISEKGDDLQYLILDASSIHDMDSSGLQALEEILALLEKKNIHFYLSSAIGPVRDLLFRSGVTSKIGGDHQFLKVHDAVLACLSNGEHSTTWTEDAIQTNEDGSKT